MIHSSTYNIHTFNITQKRQTMCVYNKLFVRNVCCVTLRHGATRSHWVGLYCTLRDVT